MIDFIASYDLKNTNPSPYGTFTKHAATFGWNSFAYMSDGGVTDLPNTTFMGSFKTRDDAVAALEAARRSTEAEIGVPVSMTRYIVGPVGSAIVLDNSKSVLASLFGITGKMS